jgi:hypothetical protein
MTTGQFQVAFVALGLLYPDVAITARQPLAQAIHESANFTSHVWQVDNNCMGMMAPSARETTCTNKGQAGAYAHYSNPLDGIRDIFLWCRAMGIKNDGDLDRFIKAGKYAADKQYYTKVQKQIASLAAAGKYINPATILGTGLAAAGAVTLAGVAAISHIIEEIA